ncbi:hypothetical protein [Roseobacter cerasinus]|nr:hypothetical protein [Roseobacter cerasinus]
MRKNSGKNKDHANTLRAVNEATAPIQTQTFKAVGLENPEASKVA